MPEKSDKPKRPRINRKKVVLSVDPAPQEKKEFITIDEPILNKIGHIADSLGVSVYIVGGFVRDYYLNRLRTDFDFTIVGDPIEFAKETAKKFNSKAVIYQRFRTALVPVGDYKLEFVGTRKEEYLPDSRKPVVTEGTLEDDLRRRDFTINAMAASLNKGSLGQVIDIFGGKDDLELRLLRTPLDPYITFSDDPLRMMRAARFASQLNFAIDSISADAIKKMASRISIISQERISDEFIKILASDRPSIGLNILFETGLLDIIFPELARLAGVEVREENGRAYAHKDILIHTLQVLDKVATLSENAWLRFAALVHDIGKSRTKQFVRGIGWTFHGHEDLGGRWMDGIFRRMKLPLEKLPYVEKLVRLHQRPMALVDQGVTDSAIRRLAFQAGDALEDLFLLCRSDITTNNPKLSVKYLKNYDIVARKVMDVQEKDKLREFQSPVRGDEIMQICGIKPSRAVGILKSAIEEAILDGIIPNEYEAAKEYFLEHKDEWLEKIEKGELL
jgi:poly(A) polymerase